MYVVVSVISHEHKGVLPRSGVALCRYGKSSYRHIELVAEQRILSLTVVEHAEVAVVDVAAHLIERVLALKAQQVVVRIEVAALLCEHSVVPHTVSEEHQILRHVVLG